MTSILRQMSDIHYTQYIDHFHTCIDLMDFLMEILMTFKDLVSNNVYPPDWNDMIMLQNRCILSILIVNVRNSKVNVFTSVCQEFCPRGGGGYRLPGQTPQADTPSWADTPHPHTDPPPPGQWPPLQRTVRILLECILVGIMLWSSI